MADSLGLDPGGNDSDLESSDDNQLQFAPDTEQPEAPEPDRLEGLGPLRRVDPTPDALDRLASEVAEQQQREDASAQERAEAQPDEQEPRRVNLARAREENENEYKGILGKERYDLLKPDADVPVDEDEEDDDEEAAARIAAIYAQAVRGNYDDYDEEKAFRDDAAATEEDKTMWKLWDDKLRRKRRRDWARFVDQVQYHEDLMYGPRKDNEEKRIWSGGFIRDGETQQVLWEYWTSRYTQEDDEAPVERKRGSASDVLDAKKDDPKTEFRPARKEFDKKTRRQMRRLLPMAETDEHGNRLFHADGSPVIMGKSRVVRDPLTGVPLEDPNNPGRPLTEPIDDMLRMHEQYERDKSGKKVFRDGMPVMRVRERNVNPSIARIRLQMISIRLNAHHWEWHYSRHLQNHEMFDTPSMTPYLHNNEFEDVFGNGRLGAHASGAAIPLLTRGTLGFEGVRLDVQGNLVQPTLPAGAAPAIAIDTLDRVTGANAPWTLARLRGLPRIREINITRPNVKLLPKLASEATGHPTHTFPNTNVTVDFLFLDNPNTPHAVPTWATVFRLKEGNGAFEYYANAYTSNETTTHTHLGVNGYDSWVNGTGPAAILASTDPANADKRLRLAFEGLPLFFAGENNDNLVNGKTAVGPFYDARVHVRQKSSSGGGEPTGANKYYSEVYRELMFEPLPVRSVATLPPAASSLDRPYAVNKFRDKLDNVVGEKDASESVKRLQMPKYLNFSTNLSGSRTAQGQSLPKTREEKNKKADEDLYKGGDNLDVAAGNDECVKLPRHMAAGDDNRRREIEGVRQALEQHYPEVVLCYRSQTNDLARQVSNYRDTMGGPGKKGVRKAQAGKDKQTSLSTRHPALSKLQGDKKPPKNWRTEMGLDQPVANQSVELQAMAPTTLFGAMARYVTEHGVALAYYTKKNADGTDIVDEHGNPKRKLIDASPERLNQPGGLYYSCRIDTGTGPNQGGLDTLLPLGMDATVYDIAEVNLARGAHDYLYTEPVQQDGTQMRDDDFTERAGPPHWWTLEQQKLYQNVDPFFRGYNDPRPFDKDVHYYDQNHPLGAIRPVASIWTEGVTRAWPQVANQNQHPPPQHHTDRAAPTRALYDHVLSNVAPADPARRMLFATSQLRRLDTTEGYPERADVGDPSAMKTEGKPDFAGYASAYPVGEGSTLHRALKEHLGTPDRLLPSGYEGLVGPTRVSVASAATTTLATENKKTSDQTVMFERFYPAAHPGNGPQAPASAQGVQTVEALPHRYDMRVPCMPIYPTRLGLQARKEAWKRVCLQQKAQRADEDPDVVSARRAAEKAASKPTPRPKGADDNTDADKYRTDLPDGLDEFDRYRGYGAKGARKKGYHAARSDAAPRVHTDQVAGVFGRVLVAPLYVVALEFDDFKQAVRTTDLEWGDFFMTRKPYLLDKDKFQVQQRPAGGGKFVEYLVPNPKYRLPVATYPPRKAGDWRTHDGPWYHGDEAPRNDQTGIEERGTLTEADWERLELARRPDTRLRASWFDDRYDFGRYEPPTRQAPAASALELFKKRVDAWLKMYRQYTEMQASLSDAATANDTIKKHADMLATHSLRLCWGLTRLGQTADPTTLYASDGMEPMWSNREDLLRQWMSPPDDDVVTNPFWELKTRLPLAIFFIDMVDHVAGLRKEIAWLEQRHFELTGTEDRLANATRARAARRAQQEYDYEHLDSLGTIKPPSWPEVDDIDHVCHLGGEAIAKVLVALWGDEALKDAIFEKAQRILDEARRAGEDAIARVSRYAPENIDEDEDGNPVIKYNLDDDRIKARPKITALINGFKYPDPEVENDHALAVQNEHHVRLFLEAWVRTIVDDQLAKIDDVRNPSAVADYTDFGRAIKPLEDGLINNPMPQIALDPETSEEVGREIAFGKSADLHAAAVLFGLRKVKWRDADPVDDGSEHDKGKWPGPFDAPLGPTVKYARELKSVHRLMQAQVSLMMDAQLFQTNRKSFDAKRDDYEIMAFTADAFKFIFSSVQGTPTAVLNEMLQELLTGTLPEAQRKVLEDGLAQAKARFRAAHRADTERLLEPSDDPGDAPDALFMAFKIAEAATGTYSPEAQQDAANLSAVQLSQVRKLMAWYDTVRKKAITAQTSLRTERARLANAPNADRDAYLKAKEEELKLLLDFLREIKGMRDRKRFGVLARLGGLMKKARKHGQQRERRVRPRPEGQQAEPPEEPPTSEDDTAEHEEDVFGDIAQAQQAAADEPDIYASGLRIDDFEAPSAELQGAASVWQEIRRERAAQEENDRDLDAIANLTQELRARYPDQPLDVLEADAREQYYAQKAMRGAAGPSSGAFFDAPPSLPPSPPSEPMPMLTGLAPTGKHSPTPMLLNEPDSVVEQLLGEKQINEKRKAFEKQQLSEVPAELVALLESELDVLRASYDEAVRKHDAMQALYTKQKWAFAQVRAYLLRAELDEDAAARRAEQLEALNDGLRRFRSDTPQGLTYSEYLARLDGIGITDPEACNDSNVNDIDVHEVHGWKGQYRLHVGRMLRVLPTGGLDGGPCYHLDALPPTPRQWLESEDAVYASGPPLPPRIDADARADAAMLQETSLDWAVDEIVGPKNANAKEAADVKATLAALLQADRERLLDARRSRFAPWAFDFDMLAPSSVVPR